MKVWVVLKMYPYEGAELAEGVFSSEQKAEEWISRQPIKHGETYYNLDYDVDAET